jgi:hypothetical protein
MDLRPTLLQGALHVRRCPRGLKTALYVRSMRASVLPEREVETAVEREFARRRAGNDA